MHKFKFLLLFLVIFQITFSQRGKDGDYTVGSLNTHVNTYTTITAQASSNYTSITVVDNKMVGGTFLDDLQAGDLLLIYQVQGTDVDVNFYPITGNGGNYTVQDSYFTSSVYSPIEFGAVRNYGAVGKYEFAEVRSVSGTNTINLICPLKNTYYLGTKDHPQVVRIPRYKNLTVPSNTSITGQKWDGTTGGVTAVEVDKNLNVTGNGRISADESGFRGGTTILDSSAAPVPGAISDTNSRGYLGSPSRKEGAEKGESIYGNINDYNNILYSRYGYGSIANGGGGGGYHNAGGGGGSNVGVGNYYSYGVVDRGPSNIYDPAWNLESSDLINKPSAGGGRGGYSHSKQPKNPLTVGPHDISWDSDFRRISGGVGGHPLAYDPDRAFMGGGGGAGHENDGYGGAGGTGGGVVFLNVYGDITGGGTVSANGAPGGSTEGIQPDIYSFTKTGEDGAGGAGGGGAIVIKNINTIPTTLKLEAKGGKGGDEIINYGGLVSGSSKTQADGPGGGGAGGMIAFSTGSPTQSVMGGKSGTTSSNTMANFPVNGATGGAEGMDFQLTHTFDIIVENDTICKGENTTLTATIIGNPVSTLTLNWYSSYTSTSSLHTGTSYTTPNLNSTTTYYVETCDAAYRVPVQAVISPDILISGIPPTITDETCTGNDGSITGIIATGGTGTLTYSWSSSGGNNINVTGATAGTYTLTVTDGANCTSTTVPFTINASTPPTIDASGISITDETCTGSDGSITGITVSGGTGTLIYSWSNSGGNNLNVTGATAGTYTLTVTDGANCTSISSPYTIGSSGGVTIDASAISISNETCNGNDGSITGITASSGTGPLTYSWSPLGGINIDVTGATAGTYTLTVTDGANCTSITGPFTINVSTPPTIDASGISITDETCNGNDGSITGLTASGGTGTLSYSWSNSGGSNIDVIGATAGTYTLTVTDGANCTSTTGPYTINTSPSPTIDASGISITDETCNGNDGSITGLTASGGTGTLSYSWSNSGGSNLDLTGVTAGTYTLTVTDGANCTSTTVPFTINASTPPTIDASGIVISNETCNGNDGSITGITVTGGTGTLTYSWSPSGVTGLDLTGVAAGNYTLIVTDNKGCSKTSGPHTINLIPSPTIDGSNIVITNASCGLSNGTITGFSLAGGSGPYTYDWNGVPSQGIDLIDVANGTYNLTVTDNNGCVVSSGPYTINAVSGPTINDSGVLITNESCDGNDGSISGITVANGTLPLTYNWNGNISSTTDLVNAQSGSYELIVKDANGCTDTVGPFIVNGAIIPNVDILTSDQTIEAGESVTINTTVNPGDATINWNPVEGLSCSNCSNPIAIPDESTMYIITVTSIDGCTSQDSLYIEVKEPCGEVAFPTVFSPNGDGLNDKFCILGGCIYSMKLQIFDRWGEKVFESTDPNDCWDGTYRGKMVNTGVYVYKFAGTKSNGSTINLSGNINVIR